MSERMTDEEFETNWNCIGRGTQRHISDILIAKEARRARASEAALFARLAEVEKERDRYRGENELNGEAIMEVRHHLEAVGIRRDFVDDCAAVAAHKIKTLREALDQLYGLGTCEECGGRATRLCRTEGDGSFWFCDSTDAAHGPEFYCWEEERRLLAPAALSGVESGVCS